MKKKTAAILCVLWLMVMVGIAASSATLLFSGKNGSGARWVSAEDYEMLERYSRLESIRRQLTEDYYLEVDDAQLIEGAIDGMMASLDDPYTFYYTAEEMTKRNEETEGAYNGLGLLLQNNDDGRIEVVRVYKKSPAEKAGLRVGDCILQINGRQVYGSSAQTLDEAASLMKGSDGTEIQMEILRGSEILHLAPICGDVNVSNVNWSMLDDSIAYLSIFQFSGNAVEGFKSAVNALKEANIRGLVVDLRNNPGGILDDVVEICDLLLPKGLIVYIEDRDGGRTDYYSDEDCWDVPMVVLVNDMSASASEIFAAAMQDYNRAAIVGTTTYGKGVVQTVVSFPDEGDGIQYTSASYYTPNGRSIHTVGVTPDYIVKNDNSSVSYSGEADIENDAQLRTAIQLLKDNN